MFCTSSNKQIYNSIVGLELKNKEILDQHIDDEHSFQRSELAVG